MKKTRYFLVFLMVLCVTFTFAKKTKPNDATLISHVRDNTIVEFKITSYDLEDVQTAAGPAQKLVAPYTSEILEKGAPEVRKISTAVIVPDDREMEVKVLNSKYEEIENVDLVPSKGNLLRTVNPDDVPYEYGPEYQTDAFYPANIVELTHPYIARDYRGQAIILYPFQYNPVTKVLRVYTRVKVKVSPTGKKGKNLFDRPHGRKIPREFKNVYARHFINYNEVAGSLAQVQYTPLTDDIGTMLIICYSSFMDEMADFVSWKENIGYTIDLVDYSTIGSSSALKTYVANYYNSSGLTFLLLVGDHAQVPTSSTSAGDSDNNYGYIVGSDRYLDIFVGRFSAETAAHVTTQVDRTIYYERDLSASANWFRHAIGMGSSEGPGHNSEYDYQHINNILSDLSGYGYTTHTNHQSGGSTSNLTNLINNGAGTMWYCGHGNNTCWTCGWNFCSSNVNGLTNENELPAIFSVACLVGNFRSQTCFCESWQRATNNGNPTGSVVHAGSTISQSWVPPMDAQDEFADLLVSTSGPKRTFGGVFVNGMFKMIDINGSGGADMADTWTCFGDPSVQLRTPGTPEGPPPVTPDPPVADFTSDTVTVMVGGSVNFSDLSTNNPTSWDWTFEGGTPSSSTNQNPTITYNTAGTYDVVLTATNSAGSDTETKVDYITVTALQPPVADFTASSTSISVGDSVTFTDQSTNNPTSWSWTFEGGTPGTSTAQNPTITYNTAGTFNVTLTASNGAGSDTETKVDYIDVSAVPYCTSSAGNQSYEYIAGVQVADLNNTSGASPYTDYTNLVANVTQDTSVSVSLTPGFPGSSYTEYWKIWIDYNGDHDFEDAGEEVFAGSGSSVVSGNFTVPTSTITGDTRMRVSMSYSTYPPICGTFTYGEVEDYTVNITAACTQYTLTTNTVGNGSITLNPPGGTYCEGTVVTLTAVPDAGWQFDNWSGDLSGTQNPTTITMSSNLSVTANFSEVPVQQYTLTVNTVGQGSVALNPPGGVYNEGTVVTLTATADTGWKFDNWSGDLTGSTNPDTITMNANKTVTAHFSEVGNCTETVGNTTVFGSTSVSANRRAMPFTMPENGNICSVTMYHEGGSGGLILGVYDGEGTPQNRLGVTPTTTINSSAGWQTINLTSPAYVAGGTTVWLAWVFQSNPGIAYQTGSPGRYQSSDTWSGGMPDPFGSGSQTSYIYSIYANYTPSAPPQYTLTVNIVGQGSVDLNPPGGVYDAGTEVTLTATADSGWQFDGWSGDLSGTANPATITINSNMTVTANFSEVGTTGTVGNTTVFGSTSTSAYRRAMPFTMPENGTITSVTMYHTGGSGDMILAVYDGEGTPQARLAITPTTAVSGSTGWQTINLTSPAAVTGGQTVWLAWVYQSNPGIRYQTGSPGRYQSSQTWSGGMPDPFGTGSQTSYIYSIYATYNK